MTQPLSLQLERIDGVDVLFLADSTLTHSQVSQLGDTLAELFGERNPTKVVVDVSGLNCDASSTLVALLFGIRIGLHQKSPSDLCLGAVVSQEMVDSLQIIQIHTCIPLFLERAEAVNSVSTANVSDWPVGRGNTLNPPPREEPPKPEPPATCSRCGAVCPTCTAEENPD